MKGYILCVILSLIEGYKTLQISVMNRIALKPNDIEKLGTYLERKTVDGKDPQGYAIGILHPQVLPYMVLTYKGLVFTYSRKKGKETRLYGSCSIGIGGHIDQEDSVDSKSIYETFLKAREREANEEVGLPDLSKTYVAEITTLDAILDYTNSVGSVHIGFPCVLELTDAGFAIVHGNESELSDAKWLPIEEVKKYMHQYENWSQELIRTAI